MKAILEVKMNNAAFDDQGALELSRILDTLRINVLNDEVCRIGDRTTARDINGNTVGKLEIVED